MQEIGTIVDFSDGKAVVELEGKSSGCGACPSSGFCSETGGKRRMVLDVIPGIAKGTQVYVDVGPRPLLKMPTLAYLMVGAFVVGMLTGQVIFNLLLNISGADIASILSGLIVTAGAIVGVSIKEKMQAEEGFSPKIAGVVWKSF